MSLGTQNISWPSLLRLILRYCDPRKGVLILRNPFRPLELVQVLAPSQVSQDSLQTHGFFVRVRIICFEGVLKHSWSIGLPFGIFSSVVTSVSSAEHIISCRRLTGSTETLKIYDITTNIVQTFVK